MEFSLHFTTVRHAHFNMQAKKKTNERKKKKKHIELIFEVGDYVFYLLIHRMNTKRVPMNSQECVNKLWPILYSIFNDLYVLVIDRKPGIYSIFYFSH